MELLSEHDEVISRLQECENGVFYLTGPAGSGKTTLVHYLREHIFENVICAAPTGVAALNIKGQTLHSLFRLPLGPLIPGDERLMHSKFRKKNIAIFRQCELLVIDEISMVRADILDAVNVTLQRLLYNNEPFGGKRVLLVGDLFQLEPVVKFNESGLLAQFYQSPFFFHANVFNHLQLDILKLKTIFRQKDKNFIGLLNQVKVGEADEYVLEKLQERVTSNYDEKAIVLCGKRADADTINKHKLQQLPGTEKLFSGIIQGEFPNEVLPTDVICAFRIGARVMFVRNDTQNQLWVNGTLGTVVDFSTEKIHVQLDNEEIVKVGKEIWENTQYDYDENENKITEKVLGTYTQFPLKLAFAITIHKSQGLTFDYVHVNLGPTSFASGLLYVALSRCTSLEGLTLQRNLVYKDFRVNPIVRDFAG